MGKDLTPSPPQRLPRATAGSLLQMSLVLPPTPLPVSVRDTQGCHQVTQAVHGSRGLEGGWQGEVLFSQL